MKMIDKRTIQVPSIQPVKFIERNNGVLKGYAVNTYHGLVKKYNEDRVSIIMNITKPHHKGRWPKCSYFAIFDGHGGNACSDFLKQNMHKYITENDHFPYKPIEALKQGFKKAQQEFVKIAQSKEPLQRSGSCAIVILIIDQTCYIANVGDSRAILSTKLGKKVFSLSKDHKPDDPLQKERIIAAGGNIYQSVVKLKNGQTLPGPFRINPGKLSVSRAFGDVQAKSQKLNGNPKVLIAKPEITYFEINMDQHDFIFMGSDGIFDKLTNQEIAQVVWDSLYSRKKSLKSEDEGQDLQYVGQASSRIIQKAMSNYSLDNLTSLLVMFQDNGRSKLPTKQNSKPYQYKSRKVDQYVPIKKSYSTIRLKPQEKAQQLHNNQNKMVGINQLYNKQDLAHQKISRIDRADKNEKIEKIQKTNVKRKSMGDTRGNDMILDFRSPSKMSPAMILTRKTSKNNVNAKKESIWKLLNEQNNTKIYKPRG